MTKIVVPFALLFLVTACATQSAENPIEIPEPLSLPPSVCSGPAPEPAFPDGASLVQPVTEEEQTATEKFLLYVTNVLRWGRGLEAQVETVQEYCQQR